MNTLNDVFDHMTSFEYLLEAYKNARKRKKYRKDFQEFEQDLDANLLKLQKELRDGTFHFGPYRRHWVYVPKKRLVTALPVESRIVQWAIYMTINPYYDRRMIEDSYACREGKGSLRAARRMQYFLRLVESKPQKYEIIKMDVSKFFYRVDHGILKEIISRGVRDERLLALIYDAIDSPGERFGLPRFTNPEELEADEWLEDVGIAIGNLTSQLFGNIYLNEVDQYAKHRLHIRYYLRYMDDIVMLVPKGTGKEVMHEVEVFMKEHLALDVNRKSSVLPFGRIEFVGYIVTPGLLRVRKKTARRIKRAVRGISRKYFNGTLTREEMERRFESYRGMMCHYDAENLRRRLNEIYTQEQLRQTA